MAVRKRRETGLGGTLLWFFCVLTVVSLSGVVAWLSLTPKYPQFNISHVQFPSSNTTAADSLFFDLEIFNPNKRMGIYYNDAIAWQLYWRGGVVGTSSTPGFYQRHKDSTTMKSLIRGDQELLKGMVSSMEDLDFMIRVDTNFRFRIFKWKTHVREMVYEAHFSNVKISGNGTVSGGSYRGLVKHVSTVKIKD